jgi:hypothetical protein
LLAQPPERYSRIWRLSAIFQTAEGAIVCSINRNELLILADNRDVIQQGRTFLVKGPEGQNDALMEIEPPNRLHVRLMNIVDGNKLVRVRPDAIYTHCNTKIFNVSLQGPSMIMDKQGHLSFGLSG